MAKAIAFATARHCPLSRRGGAKAPRPAPAPPPAGASRPPGRALASVSPGRSGLRGTVPRGRGKRRSRFLFPPKRVIPVPGSARVSRRPKRADRCLSNLLAGCRKGADCKDLWPENSEHVRRPPVRRIMPFLASARRRGCPLRHPVSAEATTGPTRRVRIAKAAGPPSRPIPSGRPGRPASGSGAAARPSLPDRKTAIPCRHRRTAVPCL